MEYKGEILSDNLTPSQIALFKHFIDKGMTVKEIKLMFMKPDDVIPPEERAGGGMMNINRMTAPLGYANGGPAGMTQPERENVEYARMMKEFEESVGPKEPGMFYKGLQKITGDETVDPMWKAKEKLKDLGSKGLEGIRSLFGAKEAGASELSDKIKQLENLEFLRTMSLGMPGSTLFTPSSPETIERLDKQIRDLRLEIFGEE